MSWKTGQIIMKSIRKVWPGRQDRKLWKVLEKCGLEDRKDNYGKY